MAKRHHSRAEDLTSAFVRLEELVLANTDADEFDEILALLMARLWDQRCGESTRFHTDGGPGATRARCRALLDEARRRWPDLLPESLEPSLSDESLVSCVEIMAGPRFDGTHLEALDGLFEGLVGHKAKGAKGQYFTPRHVAELAVRMVDPRPGELVLDPACGSGGFLWQAARWAGAGVSLLGTDIDPRAVRIARILMTVGEVPGAAIERVNSLIPASVAGEQHHLEALLAARGRTGADVIVTNPPFAGEVRQSRLLQGYRWGQGRTRVERDVLFLERCVKLLRPGGRMAIVLPYNKLGAEAFEPLRRWLFEQVQVLGVVGLHRNTFLPHTHQKAGLLLARRREAGEGPSAEEPTFFAVSERPGKGPQGRPILRENTSLQAAAWEGLDHDLHDIAAAWADFRGPLPPEAAK